MWYDAAVAVRCAETLAAVVMLIVTHQSSRACSAVHRVVINGCGVCLLCCFIYRALGRTLVSAALWILVCAWPASCSPTARSTTPRHRSWPVACAPRKVSKRTVPACLLPSKDCPCMLPVSYRTCQVGVGELIDAQNQSQHSPESFACVA